MTSKIPTLTKDTFFKVEFHNFPISALQIFDVLKNLLYFARFYQYVSSNIKYH
jgi:hypothetical protein